MNYLQLYKDALSTVLSSLRRENACVDPMQTTRLMFTLRMYFVAYCYAASRTKVLGHQVTTLKDAMGWIKSNLSCDSPFLYVYEETEEEINYITNSFLCKIDAESLSRNVGCIYESLLHTDVSEATVTDGDTSRNVQGSYYSPTELATHLTQSVIENFIKRNGLEALRKARMIDFSCGSGIFLVESLRYISVKLNLSKEGLLQLVNNLYACDVDFIALEICKFNIIDLVDDLSVYAKLSKNFRHANFLLDTKCEKDIKQKINAYLHGFIYHGDLAIGADFLTEYDIILGNPPWEKVRFEEKSFFAQYVSSIGQLNFKQDLNTAIAAAESSNQLLKEYCIEYKAQIDNAKKTIKKSSRFTASSNGELNTSNLFTEAAYTLMSDRASVGIIIKSSTVATKASKPLFAKISNRIISIYDFINKRRYFNIDNRERFTLLMMDTTPHRNFNLAMNILDVEGIKESVVKITPKELRLLNPETEMIPNLTSSKDLPIMVSLYKSFKTIAEEFPTLKYGRLVHFTNHAEDIDKFKLPDNIPIYEGKFFSALDGAYAGFNHVSEVDRYKSKAHAKKLSDADRQRYCYPESRFFIKETKWQALSANYHADYMLAWHSLTSATNERACVATILPFIPASQSVQFLTADSTDELIYLCCLFNSAVFDYIVKNKLTGIDLTQSFIKQIAIPNIDYAKQCIVKYNENMIPVFSLLRSICHKILGADKRLSDMWPKNITKISGLPSDRKSLIALLDILTALLYRISSDDFEYIFSYNSYYQVNETKGMLEQLLQLSQGIKP